MVRQARLEFIASFVSGDTRIRHGGCLSREGGDRVVPSVVANFFLVKSASIFHPLARKPIPEALSASTVARVLLGFDRVAELHPFDLGRCWRTWFTRKRPTAWISRIP